MASQFPEINIVIPMAGAGSRFAKVGYKDPKPLIKAKGKPMIELVVENVRVPKAHFIFVVQKAHEEQFALSKYLGTLVPGCDVVFTDGLTEGAACTVLLAKEFIDNDKPLLTANSDQFLEWDSEEFVSEFLTCDGGISTFFLDTKDTKWSYAKLDAEGYVTEVQEKKPISDLATTGIYYWSKGSDFVKYAQQMIAKNIRVNNEFYVCPVYNEGIADGKKYRIKNCKRMWGIGVPEDLEFFEKNYQQ